MRVLVVSQDPSVARRLKTDTQGVDVVAVAGVENVRGYQGFGFDAAVIALGSTYLSLGVVRAVRDGLGDIPCVIVGDAMSDDLPRGCAVLRLPLDVDALATKLVALTRSHRPLVATATNGSRRASATSTAWGSSSAPRARATSAGDKREAEVDPTGPVEAARPEPPPVTPRPQPLSAASPVPPDPAPPAVEAGTEPDVWDLPPLGGTTGVGDLEADFATHADLDLGRDVDRSPLARPAAPGESRDEESLLADLWGDPDPRADDQADVVATEEAPGEAGHDADAPRAPEAESLDEAADAGEGRLVRRLSGMLLRHGVAGERTPVRDPLDDALRAAGRLQDLADERPEVLSRRRAGHVVVSELAAALVAHGVVLWTPDGRGGFAPHVWTGEVAGLGAGPPPPDVAARAEGHAGIVATESDRQLLVAGLRLDGELHGLVAVVGTGWTAEDAEVLDDETPGHARLLALAAHLELLGLEAARVRAEPEPA